VNPPLSEAMGRSPSAFWALASLALSILLSSLGTSIANVALPTLAETFHASFAQVQWIVLAYLLAITAVIVSVGRLGDLVGRRRLLLAGIALFALASLLCGMAPTLGLLIAARAIQGLGAAIMMALAIAAVGDAIPKTRTGNAMGLLGSMSAIGTALGPSLGGLLIAALGWRAIFLVSVPVGGLSFFLAWRHLPIDQAGSSAERPRFDIGGTLLLTLALAAYALAMTGGRGGFGWINIFLLIAAGAGGALFLVGQKRAASPLIQPALLRDRMLRSSLAASALVSTVMMSTLVVGPFYLSRSLGLEAALVGLVLSVGPIAAALGAIPAGRIADRFGSRKMTVVGLIGIASGALTLSLTPMTLGVAGYIAPMIVVTLGYAQFQTANNTQVMNGVEKDQRGVVSAMLNLSRNLGLITGASFMGAVFSFASGGSAVGTAGREAVAVAMRTTFAVATLLILIALAFAVAANKRPSLCAAGSS
jgi:EmrB/QacA subfamily drug resistance transporter